MTRARRPAQTPEQRKAAAERRAAALAELKTTATAHQAALTDPARLRGWLDTAARFPTLSLPNQLLVANQRPDATLLAGYGDWQTSGRQVTKGQKGIRLIASGRVATVFDVSQTEGEALPEVEPAPVTWQQLEQAAADHGIGLGDTNGVQATAVTYALAVAADRPTEHLPVEPFDPNWDTHTINEAAAQINESIRSIWTISQHSEAAVDPATAAAATTEHSHTARAAQTHAKAEALAADWQTARTPAGQTPTPDRLTAALTAAQAFYIEQAANSPAYDQAVAARSIDPAVARDHFGIGLAPGGWTAATDHLRAQGFTDSELLDAGISQRARTGNLIDVMRDRITFAYKSAERDVIGFSGRDLTGDERAPKYLNTKTTEVFNKSTALIGSEHITARADQIVIVEGPWDAASITWASNGKAIGVAPSGTAFTQMQADQIAATGKPVVVWMDGDTAGAAAAAKAHGTLASAGIVNARQCSAMGLDPSEALQYAGASEVTATLASRHRPLAVAVVDEALTGLPAQPRIESKVTAIKRIGHDISAAPPAVQAAVAQHLADRLDLPTLEVVDALAAGEPVMPGRTQGPPQGPTIATNPNPTNAANTTAPVGARL